MAVLGLPAARLSSSCREREPLSGGAARASRCSGSSCCRAQALECTGVSSCGFPGRVQAQQLRHTIPDQGSNPCIPRQADSSPLSHQGSPKNRCLHSGPRGKASACSAGDLGSIPGSGRSPGEGNGNPLQSSCLENPMDRGAWWATAYRVSKSRRRLKRLCTQA